MENKRRLLRVRRLVDVGEPVAVLAQLTRSVSIGYHDDNAGGNCSPHINPHCEQSS
jgi:hypothetical protein